MTKNARFSLLPSFIIMSAVLLAGCNDQGETQAHPAEPQVNVHVVEKGAFSRDDRITWAHNSISYC